MPGIDWLTELPYRRVDPAIRVLHPARDACACRSRRAADGPVELLVEYAYCVVDFQCFFGEETLTVATTATP